MIKPLKRRYRRTRLGIPNEAALRKKTQADILKWEAAKRNNWIPLSPACLPHCNNDPY